jgi:hypothetical protein
VAWPDALEISVDGRCGQEIIEGMISSVIILRVLSLLLLVAHLMIRAVAVPHMHEAAHGLPVSDHGSRPHIHLGGHGHYHDHEHVHDDREHQVSAPAATTSDEVAATSPCCCHDDDAIDVSMSTPAGSPDWRRAGFKIELDVILSLPARATAVRPEPDGYRGLSSRPPGNRVTSRHDIFPHVLRI